ncbi:MAG: RidA family protein [Chitinophagaceae bacterium]
MERMLISSGTNWETTIGYSRAVRAGNLVFVSGTTSVDQEGSIVGSGDPYLQTRYIIQKMEKALLEAGSDLTQVVRTRIFVLRMADWEKIGLAHGEFFAKIRPASTMVEVSALIHPELLVEIEMDACLS